MLYLSRLLTAQVTNIGGKKCGRVIDVVVRAPVEPTQNFPLVVGFVVRERGVSSPVYIPMDQVDEVSDRRILISGVGLNRKISIPDGDSILFLKKSVIDKQIVDLSGVRIVRVNDVHVGRIRGVLHLISLDVSNQALFRRLGIPTFLLRFSSKPNLLEWKDIQVIGNQLKVGRGASDIVRLHPADIANIIEQLNVRRGSALLQSLDRDTAARVLEEVQPDVQRLIVSALGPERAVSLMERMSIDELVDLIQQLPSHEAQNIIDRLPSDHKAQHVQHILSYDEDTAGGLMTTEYVKAEPTETVGMVMEKIKHVSEQFRSIHFVYVVDGNNYLLGVASLRKLIVAHPDVLMNDLIAKKDKTLTIGVDRSVSSVGRQMTKYNLYAIAVVGHDGKLLGVVTSDDIMRRLFPKA